jgi:predicted O-methyltransferase YrrM
MRLYPKFPARRDPALYDAKEELGVEPEFGALLYALVRIHKPKLCVETGTYTGASAEWIGRALNENGIGHLRTCDIDGVRIVPARKRLEDLPVAVHQMKGIDLLAGFAIMDFVHIDSGDPQCREEELMSLGDHNISPGGLIVWHDACLWYRNLYEKFSAVHDWPHLLLPSPVGVAIFQRPEL